MSLQHSSGSYSQLNKLLQHKASDSDNRNTLQPPVEQHRSCQQSSVGGQQSHSARLVFEVVVALLCRCFWLS